jgi:hypothetical protein
MGEDNEKLSQPQLASAANDLSNESRKRECRNG